MNRIVWHVASWWFSSWIFPTYLGERNTMSVFALTENICLQLKTLASLGKVDSKGYKITFVQNEPRLDPPDNLWFRWARRKCNVDSGERTARWIKNLMDQTSCLVMHLSQNTYLRKQPGMDPTEFERTQAHQVMQQLQSIHNDLMWTPKGIQYLSEGYPELTDALTIQKEKTERLAVKIAQNIQKIQADFALNDVYSQDQVGTRKRKKASNPIPITPQNHKETEDSDDGQGSTPVNHAAGWD